MKESEQEIEGNKYKCLEWWRKHPDGTLYLYSQEIPELNLFRYPPNDWNEK